MVKLKKLSISDNNDIVLEIRDPQTQEVVRAVPSEEQLELKKAIQDAVEKFGRSILADDKLAEKINGWAEDSSRYLLDNYGHEVANLISQTIESWDPQSTSERIEIQIGKDLQFIRINGTVVGGLAGLGIHSISELVAHFQVLCADGCF